MEPTASNTRPNETHSATQYDLKEWEPQIIRCTIVLFVKRTIYICLGEYGVMLFYSSVQVSPQPIPKEKRTDGKQNN